MLLGTNYGEFVRRSCASSHRFVSIHFLSSKQWSKGFAHCHFWLSSQGLDTAQHHKVTSTNKCGTLLVTAEQSCTRRKLLLCHGLWDLSMHIRGGRVFLPLLLVPLLQLSLTAFHPTTEFSHVEGTIFSQNGKPECVSSCFCGGAFSWCPRAHYNRASSRPLN